MKIKHDRSYLCLYDDIKSVFTFECVGKICVEGYNNNKENHEKYIKDILDYLESNYKMYQYKKDNGIKYGEEDLFYWGNGESLYFDVTLKDDNKKIVNERLVNEILRFLNDNYSNSNLYIRLQYTLKINWNFVHEYIAKNNDVNDYNIGVLYDFYHNHYDYRNYFTSDEVEKINNLTNAFIGQYNNKKVLLKNGTKGTIKYISSLNKYGLFKPRVKNKFVPISSVDLQELEIIKSFK